MSDKLDSYLNRWSDFKRKMPHMDEPFSKRNWGSDLHSVCSYQGKMKPSLAYHLVNTFSDEGDTVLDPFSGSGTIPFEACLNNRIGVGMDIGKLGVTVSNAKLRKHDKSKVDEVISQLSHYINHNIPTKKTIDDARDVAFNKTISEYYHEDTYNELLLARDFFLKNNQFIEKEDWSLVFSCLLHILHGNRPYALSRNSHPITPYAPTGDFIYKNLIEKLTDKVYKSLSTQQSSTFIPSKCYQDDIYTHWRFKDLTINSIITSPPFFDSTKFYMTNWLRYWFCGWSKEDFDLKTKDFIEVKQKKSLEVYDVIFNNAHNALANDGIMVLHLGYSKKCDMANSLIPFANPYFKVEDLFVESTEHCEKHGIRDKGSVNHHQYLVLSKKV